MFVAVCVDETSLGDLLHCVGKGRDILSAQSLEESISGLPGQVSKKLQRVRVDDGKESDSPWVSDIPRRNS